MIFENTNAQTQLIRFMKSLTKIMFLLSLTLPALSFESLILSSNVEGYSDAEMTKRAIWEAEALLKCTGIITKLDVSKEQKKIMIEIMSDGYKQYSRMVAISAGMYTDEAMQYMNKEGKKISHTVKINPDLCKQLYIQSLDIVI